MSKHPTDVIIRFNQSIHEFCPLNLTFSVHPGLTRKMRKFSISPSSRKILDLYRKYINQKTKQMGSWGIRIRRDPFVLKYKIMLHF